MIEFIEFPALGAMLILGIAIIGLIIETRRQQEEQDDGGDWDD
jgi:hypothetical protein